MKAKAHFILRTFTILALISGPLGAFFSPKIQQIHAMEQVPEELNAVIDYDIFPFVEFEKLEVLSTCDTCKEWADATILQLKRAVWHLENAPARGSENLLLLERLLSEPPASEKLTLYEGADAFTAENVARSLQSRLVLWKQVLPLLEHPVTQSCGTLPRKRLEDALRLYEQSEAICNLFLTSQNGRHWAQFFQLTPLHGQLGQVLSAHHQRAAQPLEKYANVFSAPATIPVNAAVSPGELLPEEECRRISLLVNNAFLWQGRVDMTPEQRELFESPLIRDWLAEMESWRSNPLHPLDLLSAYECYKQYGGLSDSSRLSILTRQMVGSKDRNLQDLGYALQSEFSQAHFKIYISKYLINTLLPKMEPEYDVVQENVAGQQVVGRRRADTRLHVTLIPDPSRLLLQLHINGNVVSQTTASTFPATLHNRTYGTYSATKQLELTSQGILTSPANVSANSSVRLSNVETDLDIVPIVSDLIREIAKEQYGNQHPQIQADAKTKVLTQAKQRIDSETDARFKQLNENINRYFFNVLRQRQAAFEPYQAKTTEEWLLTSWFLATPCSLGSNSKEPQTPQGAIADIKVHELGLNAVLERLDLAGKQMTLRELKQYLLAAAGRSDVEIPTEENDHVVVGFAAINPVGVRFLQNRVELSLNLKCLQVEDRQWHDFCVIVDYVPDITEAGHCRLIRQGTVQLDGRLTLLEQVALRTIFSKIFLQIDDIPLRPKLFDNNEHFAGLTTSGVRIENGWFAIGLFPTVVPENKPPQNRVLVQPVQLNGYGQKYQRPQAANNIVHPAATQGNVQRGNVTQGRTPGNAVR